MSNEDLVRGAFNMEFPLDPPEHKDDLTEVIEILQSVKSGIEYINESSLPYETTESVIKEIEEALNILNKYNYLST